MDEQTPPASLMSNVPQQSTSNTSDQSSKEGNQAKKKRKRWILFLLILLSAIPVYFAVQKWIFQPLTVSRIKAKAAEAPQVVNSLVAQIPMPEGTVIVKKGYDDDCHIEYRYAGLKRWKYEFCKYIYDSYVAVNESNLETALKSLMTQMRDQGWVGNEKINSLSALLTDKHTRDGDLLFSSQIINQTTEGHNIYLKTFFFNTEGLGDEIVYFGKFQTYDDLKQYLRNNDDKYVLGFTLVDTYFGAECKSPSDCSEAPDAPYADRDAGMEREFSINFKEKEEESRNISLDKIGFVAYSPSYLPPDYSKRNPSLDKVSFDVIQWFDSSKERSVFAISNSEENFNSSDCIAGKCELLGKTSQGENVYMKKGRPRQRVYYTKQGATYIQIDVGYYAGDAAVLEPEMLKIINSLQPLNQP